MSPMKAAAKTATRATKAVVNRANQTPLQFLRSVPEPQRAELLKLHALIRDTIPELKPRLASGLGIGYGPYHYKYASGREGDSYIVALAPRKNSISLYVTGYTNGKYLAESYASKLGVADCGKSCVRFRRVGQLNEPALRSLLRAASKGANSMSALSDGRHDRAHASR
jgi:hypothetical protein